MFICYWKRSPEKRRLSNLKSEWKKYALLAIVLVDCPAAIVLVKSADHPLIPPLGIFLSFSLLFCRRNISSYWLIWLTVAAAFVWGQTNARLQRAWIYTHFLRSDTRYSRCRWRCRCQCGCRWRWRWRRPSWGNREPTDLELSDFCLNQNSDRRGSNKLSNRIQKQPKKATIRTFHFRNTQNADKWLTKGVKSE